MITRRPKSSERERLLDAANTLEALPAEASSSAGAARERRDGGPGSARSGSSRKATPRGGGAVARADTAVSPGGGAARARRREEDAMMRAEARAARSPRAPPEATFALSEVAASGSARGGRSESKHADDDADAADFAAAKEALNAQLSARDAARDDLGSFADAVRRRAKEDEDGLATLRLDDDDDDAEAAAAAEPAAAAWAPSSGRAKRVRADLALLCTDEGLRAGLAQIDELDRQLRQAQARARAVSSQLSSAATREDDEAPTTGMSSRPETASTDAEFFLTEKRPDDAGSRFHEKRQQRKAKASKATEASRDTNSAPGERRRKMAPTDFIRENAEHVKLRTGTLLTFDQQMRIMELDDDDYVCEAYGNAEQRRLDEIDEALRSLGVADPVDTAARQIGDADAADGADAPFAFEDRGWLEQTREERAAHAAELDLDLRLAVQREAPLVVLDDDDAAAGAAPANVRALLASLVAGDALPAGATARVDELVASMRPQIDTAAFMRAERRRRRRGATPQPLSARSDGGDAPSDDSDASDDTRPDRRLDGDGDLADALRRDRRLRRALAADEPALRTKSPREARRRGTKEIGELAESLLDFSHKTSSALEAADAALKRSNSGQDAF
ncbi:hypothetical protein M885DRAFT_616020 [Pelagophyceae sp. CCMP2097]|nr:hypothetical protein M885DRAFT_616020 [Pelagophyceae sp. CCMP2097]